MGEKQKAMTPPLARFVDPLPTPPVIHTGEHGEKLRIEAKVCRQKAHRDLPPTSLWGYNGVWPGPTIEARRGRQVSVEWVNRLPARHFLPIDKTIHGAGKGVPEVRLVTHLHGAKVMPGHDGYPDAWCTSNGIGGPAFEPGPYLYPNDQEAGALWYHDHAIGATRLNVYAGLAGFYIIREQAEEALNLPSGAYEIPLMIQDRLFRPNGALYYPRVANGTHPVWVQELFGDVICVNGKVMPYLEVEPRKYRFRMLNASNSRLYHLSLRPADPGGKPVGSVADAPVFQQIGTDGGLMPAPRLLRFLVFSPAERFDIVIDFSEHKGANLVMVNDALAPYPRGGEVVPTDVMLFRVSRPLNGKDGSSVPAKLADIPELKAADAVRERMLSITELDRASDGYTVIGLLGGKHWDDPVTEDPRAESIEIWTFVNATGDVHPIHLHLVRFQVLNRQPFDAQTYLQSGKLMFTGIPIPPEANERPGWKDTVKTYPGYVTRVIQRFNLPSGVKIGGGEKYRYVWHCHILEHEDNEMMRPYHVIA